jgi:hypothetical protein
MHRRDLLKLGAASVATLAFGPDLFRRAFAATVVGPGPYGALGPPDAHGVRLPAGFTARLVARSGVVVDDTSYPWHGAPDGGACFAMAGGGWRYVSNSELPATRVVSRA